MKNFEAEFGEQILSALMLVKEKVVTVMESEWKLQETFLKGPDERR